MGEIGPFADYRTSIRARSIAARRPLARGHRSSDSQCWYLRSSAAHKDLRQQITGDHKGVVTPLIPLLSLTRGEVEGQNSSMIRWMNGPLPVKALQCIKDTKLLPLWCKLQRAGYSTEWSDDRDILFARDKDHSIVIMEALAATKKRINTLMQLPGTCKVIVG